MLATPTGLSVSRINSLKKLHVQTLDLGEKSVERLATMPDSNTLACGVVNRRLDPVSGDMVQKATFELRDATTLRVLAEMPLSAREEVTVLEPVMLRGSRYLAVGTVLFGTQAEYEDALFNGPEAASMSAKEGRILLVKPVYDDRTKAWTLTTVTSSKTVGRVNAIATIHGFLAIAAASTVSTRDAASRGT